MNRFPLAIALAIALSLATVALQSLAAPPDLQTPAPVIHLADNLGEVDGLGWCIDTLGRGFAERLQAHSCKPQGGDVQFDFEEATGIIRSVAYPAYCMQHSPNAQATFALARCEVDESSQRFAHDAVIQSISPVEDSSLCVSVGETSRAAGPFMSRDLLLEPCAETDSHYRSWVVVREDKRPPYVPHLESVGIVQMVELN